MREGCAGLEGRDKPESGDGAEGALGVGVHKSLVLLAEEVHKHVSYMGKEVLFYQSVAVRVSCTPPFLPLSRFFL